MGRALEEWSFGDLEGRLHEGRPRAGRNLRRAVHGSPPDGNAQRDGLLAEREAVSAWVHAERRRHGRRHRSLGRRHSRGRRPDLRVHRRRFRQQGRGRRVDGDSRAALEEGQCAGDDAHQPRGRELHRPRAHEHVRPRPRGIHQGRQDHGAGSVPRAGLRRVWADGRPSLLRQRRVADLSAGRDALASDQRPDQHSAPDAAAIARSDAGRRHHGADRHEGGQAARPRSGGDPSHQRARGQGDLRSSGSERHASARDERVRERGARSRRRGLRMGRRARRAAVSVAVRKFAASASPSVRMAPAPSASTPS